MNKTRALVLLSGGLDSILAVKLLLDQGVLVTGISFYSNFYNSGKARDAVKQLGIKLLEIDISNEMLELVKNPPSGHGKNMNPCVDCHAMMFRKAGKLDYDFIATGEVVGQRPFSQNKNSLNRIEKLAGLPLLRPLSAKLLEETDIEKKGLVNRNKLLDINGRSRDRQIELANKYKIKDYPSPAGGCLLTDPKFSERLKEMIEKWPNCTPDDVELLKHGRIIWVNIKPEPLGLGNCLIVVGRDKDENEYLTKLAKKGDFVFELINGIGPTTLTRCEKYKNIGISEIIVKIPKNIEKFKYSNVRNIFEYVAMLTGYYSPKNRGKTVNILIKKI